MHPITQLLTFFLFAISIVSASPAHPGGPALFARRSISGRSAHDDGSLHSFETNGVRLARGLTPLTPKNLFTPTRVRRQAASASPSIVGDIAVYRAGTSTLLGYLAPVAAKTPSVVSSPPTSKFSYTPASSASSPVELNYAESALRLAIGSLGGMPPLLSASSSSTAGFLSTTASLPAGSIPQRESTISPYYVETTIFAVDPTSNVITAQWTNYDSTQPAVVFTMLGGYLYITGSPGTAFQAHASASTLVDLVFVPR